MSLTTRRPVGLALTTAFALAAAGLAAAGLVAAPAQADLPDVSGLAAPNLQWEISPRFDDHLSTHVLTGGATETEDGVISFAGGTLTIAGGRTTFEYDGSVEGSFVPPTPSAMAVYKVTLADPIVTVDAQGEGEISAVVSAWNAGTERGPEEETEPKRVVVTTFDAPTGYAAGDPLRDVVPDWSGVLAAGSAGATTLGIPEGQPVDGKSFAPEFLGQLTPGVRAHFYASGATSDATKAPSPFTIAPEVTARVISATPAGGLRVGVQGDGFRGVTNPGDKGVYVGLAEAGGLPDVSELPTDQTGPFAAVAWVADTQIEDGTFLATLTAPTGRLDASKSYAVYTWQAHAHSNTTQDTETPVTIDWSRLQQRTKANTKTVVKLQKKPTTKRNGKVVVTVNAARSADPAGKVRLKLAGPVKRTALKALNKKDRVAWALPRLRKGAYRVVVRYTGDATTKSSRTVVKFRVR